MLGGGTMHDGSEYVTTFTSRAREPWTITRVTLRPWDYQGKHTTVRAERDDGNGFVVYKPRHTAHGKDEFLGEVVSEAKRHIEEGDWRNMERYELGSSGFSRHFVLGRP